MRFILIVLVLVAAMVSNLYPQRIVVNETRFEVDGNEIWLNAVNTPWDGWNDFGTGRFRKNWWKNHFKLLAEKGVNSVRIWISCSGGGITINNEGEVTGMTSTFFSDCDTLFAYAEKYQLYILATLFSHNHTHINNSTNYHAFRKCFRDSANIESLVQHYVVPFVQRYDDNPWCFAIDICNEIEWIHEDSQMGQLSWPQLQYFAGRIAAAVHKNSDMLVTMGSAAVKWNSSTAEGNLWSDAALQARYNDEEAYLDFYSPHWWAWVTYWFGNPVTDKTPASYKMNDRPCVVGEVAAKGNMTQQNGKDVIANTPAQTYEGCYQNGWKGVYAWTSNGVDNNGTIADAGPAITVFRDKHYGLVYPAYASIDETGIQNPELFYLHCYPNPFNGETMIRFSLADAALSKIQIFNSRGEKVWASETVQGHSGENLIRWRGVDFRGCELASGIYIVQIANRTFNQSTKILKIK